MTTSTKSETAAKKDVAKLQRAIVDGLGTGKFEIHFPRRFSGWLKFMALLPYRWYFPLVRRLTGG